MTPTDAVLLDIVSAHLSRPRDGRLERDAMDRLGMSPTRLWARVNALLRAAEAWEAHPVTLGVLRSRRERGRRAA